MRWRGRQQSSNVEDRRSSGGSGRKIAVGGGLGTIVVIVLTLLFGGDPTEILQQIQVDAPPQQTSAPATNSTESENDTLATFVSVVLKDTEEVWGNIFQEMGQTYREPQLVYFSGSVNSGCGGASAATGPFYCPADQKIYIDLSFYDELRKRFGAPGDFAMAYVVAHEVGHHVQNLLGISSQVQQQRSQLNQEGYNKLSVKLELQADFLAGVWAHDDQELNQILHPGDIEEALNAANAIGDDRLQKQAQGYVVPDAFTHGTSDQRMRWFRKGFETGDIEQGDTFSVSERNL